MIRLIDVQFFVILNNLWFFHCWWGLTTLFNRNTRQEPSILCVGGSLAFWTVKSSKRKGWRENLSIFLAGKSARMEESSSSEAIASVRETTPFVRDKQRTREMNYICAIGSRIMKMIDRYLFDIGKFYMSHLADRHGPETKLSASVCNRCAAWNRDIYIPQSISYKWR